MWAGRSGHTLFFLVPARWLPLLTERVVLSPEFKIKEESFLDEPRSLVGSTWILHAALDTGPPPPESP